MLVMQDRGDIANITINVTKLVLTTDDIAQAYCQLATMCDIGDDINKKTILLGDHVIQLTSSQVSDLYQFTDQFLNKIFYAAELELEKTFH